MSSWRNKDPEAHLESVKYDNPVPSRTHILEQFDSPKTRLSHADLCRAFFIDDAERAEGLRRRLIAMARDHQLVSVGKGRYSLLRAEDLIEGDVRIGGDGSGRVFAANPGESVYLPPFETKSVMHGDRIVVRVMGLDERGRLEGRIVRIVTRNVSEAVGRFYTEAGNAYVTPDHKRLNQEILIKDMGGLSPNDGQIVGVRISRWPDRHRMAEGTLVDVLGDHMAPGMETDIAIRNFGIPHEWSEAGLVEADGLPDAVLEEDHSGRVDLRQLPFVTIDGEDARDFDDAVYAEKKKGGGWKLWVAIADVGHYVLTGSALDHDALERGNSVYFPSRVVPMLPEKISNGLCSLNPHVDRLAMVCEMSVSARGQLSRFCFYEAVIHSHARLTYTRVARALADEESVSADPAIANFLPRLHVLHDLYRVLRASRDARGSLDFDTQETRIRFDTKGKIASIDPVERNDAHKLIEECMLLANVAAARLLDKEKLPGLYRVHAAPASDRLEGLQLQLAELGLHLHYKGLSPTPENFATLLGIAARRPDFPLIQMMVLRSLPQAVYLAEAGGHFGLNLERYAHFTSPIRRYSDLVVHRCIKALIRSDRKTSYVRRHPAEVGRPLAQALPRSPVAMDAIAEQVSTTERRADDATRDVMDWLKCEYMQDKLGDRFEGIISSVTAFGIFVRLVEHHVEGLVHISQLHADYYVHDAARHRLVGERSGQVFALGDHIMVQVARVDLDERQIDFQPVVAKKEARKGWPSTRDKPRRRRPPRGRKGGR
jgi:ribonuclease R